MALAGLTGGFGVTVAYSKRETIFETTEHQWRVDPAALVWTRPGGESLTLLWRDVTAFRAAFGPTKWKSWRHLIEIRSRQGQRLTIDNGHIKGVGDFEDRSATFTPFALACLARIAAESPAARGSIGSSPGAYAAQLIFMGLGLGLALLVLIALPVPLGALVLVKLLLIIVSLPVAVLWAVRARPRRAVLTPEAFKAGLPATSGPGT
jgi:hypothetical protein